MSNNVGPSKTDKILNKLGKKLARIKPSHQKKMNKHKRNYAKAQKLFTKAMDRINLMDGKIAKRDQKIRAKMAALNKPEDSAV